MSKFPITRKFQTIDEINDYFSGSRIVCLLCGKSLKRLGSHLAQVHKISTDEYKKIYGIPWKRGLASDESSEKQRTKTFEQIEKDKDFLHHLKTIAAVGRNKRAERGTKERPSTESTKRMRAEIIASLTCSRVSEIKRLRQVLKDVVSATGEGPRRDAAIAAAQKILNRK